LNPAAMARLDLQLLQQALFHKTLELVIYTLVHI
jgi:hypothetical protein